MAAATLTPTEDQTFDALFGFVALVLDLPDTTDRIIKGFQNQVAAPVGSYVVISPGLMVRQDFGRKRYDGDLGRVVQEAHNTYSYQVDCYGAQGPSWASILAVSWRTMWGIDNMPVPAGSPPGTPLALTPLYADAPQQLNIVNSEGQFEQRFMIRLFGQVNQLVALPQDFFDEIELDSLTTADQLP